MSAYTVYKCGSQLIVTVNIQLSDCHATTVVGMEPVLFEGHYQKPFLLTVDWSVEASPIQQSATSHLSSIF